MSDVKVPSLRSIPVVLSLVLGLLCGLARPAAAAAPAPACTQTVTAQVVALDVTLFANRIGAQLPAAMIFALASDVEPTDGAKSWTAWTPGNVQLKAYKRPRPLVLRVNAGQCLHVDFRNLTSTSSVNGQPTTRAASLHMQGLEWTRGPEDDGAWVGNNPSSLVCPPGATTGGCPNGKPDPATYILYADKEGPYLLYSAADVYTSSGSDNGGSGDGGQLQQGLFGAVIVEPPTAEYYRSQVNFEDLCLASKDHTWENKTCTRKYPEQLPVLDYGAVYPPGHPREGLPILNMLQKGSLVHSDLTAVITGPYAGTFPEKLAQSPEFHDVASTPYRREPYREFTIIYHEMLRTVQAFSDLYNASQLSQLLDSGGDNFAINYGMGGIGSEILANRLGVGPTAKCTDCKYEEFFLSSWPNGDPAMIVDNPADLGCTQDASQGYPSYNCPSHQAATRAFFPDDPSNVYHAYLRDHTKFRILHGGSDLHHIHHLHAHQWLHSPNTSSGHYLDSQAIGPGAAYTLETVYGGGGNKNLTPGDSIFHCHFYPHFAAGMWALWRVHDVLEEGTELTAYPQGTPAANSRALPDGEIVAGTPTPAIVPLPTKAMAPLPAPVRLDPMSNGTEVQVCTDTTFSNCVSNLAATAAGAFQNPGFPFFIPGVAGSRAAHPPLDFALACSGSGADCSTRGAACANGGGTCEALDGGLPRHVVATGGTTHAPGLNPLDFSKEIEKATGIGLPEEGTAIEQVAMKFHEEKTHSTQTPEGAKGEFRTNGSPPAPGAPYAEPCVDYDGNVPAGLQHRQYLGVDIQVDATFNKVGWHYPQQRMISLWGDAFSFMGLRTAQRPPEPFFMRANSNDCVHYVLANLVPNYYELDDFQVRTPTDVLGQHIHLVKFDVTSSDGAGNGWNYEDGTFGPGEVTERINAFNQGEFQPTFGAPPSKEPLQPKFIKFFGADPVCADPEKANSAQCKCQLAEGAKTVQGGRWCGSQATVQRWYVDPQLNDAGDDMTMRTVFTHDHFGPSTHQQAGLYAALVAEPANAVWLDNQNGKTMGGLGVPGRKVMQNGATVDDGGPTSWQAVVKTGSSMSETAKSFREFLLSFQDNTLMYRPFSDKVWSFKPASCPAGTVCGFCSTKHEQACLNDQTSPLYFRTVCPTVSLPNPGLSPSSLEGSCNYVPGVPSRGNLFLVTTTAKDNIWGVTTASSDAKQLQSLGWQTLPIDSAPKGLVVSGIQNKAGQPELISLNQASDNFSLSYRNEPLYQRLHSTSTDPNAGDLSYVYQSLDRKLPGELTDPPYTVPLTPGVQPGDPFTPLLRAYSGDDVQIRIVVGAHQNPHNFTMHGLKWLFEPSNVNSGWRANQTMGISEHFEFLFQVPPPIQQPKAPALAAGNKGWTDFLYQPTAAKQGQQVGNWGLLRAYREKQADLYPLPGAPLPKAVGVCPASLLEAKCKTKDAQGHTMRCYDVVATTVSDLFSKWGKPLTYNTKLGWTTPNGLLYVQADDYANLKAGNPAPGYYGPQGLAEPLVLRAAAGDCIRVNLTNKIPADAKLGANSNNAGFDSSQLPVAGINETDPAWRNLYVSSDISHSVGLHPQLVSYEAAAADGENAGFNGIQTAAPGATVTYYWYAGHIDPKSQNPYIPVEFGAANLMPSDVVNHHAYGLFGALVIEPEFSTWSEDPDSRASATVKGKYGSFRDFVAVFQDDGIIFSGGDQQGAGGFGAVNLRTEMLNPFSTNCAYRRCATKSDVSCTLSSQASFCLNGSSCPASCVLSPSSQTGFTAQIPVQTPVFCAQAGQEARFRVLHPGGAVTNNVFELSGHPFPEEPYVTPKSHCSAPLTHTNLWASNSIAANDNQCPDGNAQLGVSLSEWKASRAGHGPANHFDVVVASAGGANKVPGDYFYRTFPAPRMNGGIWGLFRVTAGDPATEPNRCPSFHAQPSSTSSSSASVEGAAPAAGEGAGVE